MEVQVIDNFLPEDEFKHIESFILSERFPWYFYDGIVDLNDGKYQFTHGFMKNQYAKVPNEPDINFPVVEPCLKKLGCKTIYRIKANLVPKTFFHRRSVYHNDLEGSDLSSQLKTAIFYINTCNGWTQFKKGGKVKSVANRIVIFDHILFHAGVTCTDEKRRVVVNFNYV